MSDKKKKLIISVLGVLLVIIAYFIWGSARENAVVQSGPGYVILSFASQNGSNVSGTAKIEELKGRQAYVTIDVSKGPAGASQPANVSFGSCAALGQPKYPLAAVVDGHSETLLGGTLAELKKELPLAISIGKSDNQPGSVIACADIRL